MGVFPFPMPFSGPPKFGSFSPLALFAASEPGGWYDPSDLTTLFQDAAGTTPVTAVEQPVGLVLDKSRGLTLGSELVTNGGPFTDTTGWTAYRSTLSAVSSKLRVAEDGVYAAAYARQSFSVVSGKSYRITVSVSNITASKAQIWVGSVYAGANWLLLDNITTSRTVTAVFTATTSTAFLGLLVNGVAGGTTEYAEFDNISVRELPGSHLSQSTSTARPVLSARVNLLTQTENLSVSPWNTLAQGTGVTPTRTANAGTDPLGGNTATRFQLARSGTATGDRSSVHQTASLVSSGTDYVFSVFLKSYSGSSQKVVLFPNYGNGVGLEVTATSAWQRFTVTANTLTGTTARVDIALGFATSTETSADILVWGADLRPANAGVGLPAYQRVGAATAGSSTAAGSADYDTTGFPYYLRPDGTDDGMSTAAIDFSGTDKMAVFAGVRKLSDAAASIIVELSANINTNNGAFIVAPGNFTTATGAYYHASSKGSAIATLNSTLDFASPITNVVSGLFDISGDLNTIRINGTQNAQSTADQGTGNFGNYPLYVARRGGTSLPFNGHIYGLVVVGRALTAAEITATETWVNGKTKAY